MRAARFIEIRGYLHMHSWCMEGGACRRSKPPRTQQMDGPWEAAGVRCGAARRALAAVRKPALGVELAAS